jgi:acetyl esterase/lipase
LYVFEPEKREEKNAVILFLNGGSFHKGPLSPLQFQHQANYFSTLGVTAICTDYRNSYDEGFSPTQAICDTKSAVRWVRKHADQLGIDRNKIVVCGASAGGYMAIASLMFEDIDDDIDRMEEYVPNALIMFAAVMDGVDIMRRRFPELLEKAERLSPLHNIKSCLPQTLWICGTADIDYVQNKEFIEQMVQAGNKIEFKTYQDMEHGFFNYGKHENKYFHETKLDIENYLRSLEFIV